MSKHLIACCDGTWQKREQPYPTNVARIFNAFAARKSDNQIVNHDDGVGTENFIMKILGGAFGLGLNKNILDSYQFLCKNYSPGDHIYLFGFSRGAYTVRSLVGLIYKCGLVKTGKDSDIKKAMRLYRNRKVKPDDPQSRSFRKNYSFENEVTDNRPWIDFMGCWDTVGSLGVPDLSPRLGLDKWINSRYRFYDTKISFIIRHARHAVAIDEKRKVFDVTPMHLSSKAKDGITELKEVWFCGDHGCVGGGEFSNQAQSEITLNWMYEEFKNLKESSLPDIDNTLIPAGGTLKPLATITISVSDFYKKLGLIQRSGPEQFSGLHWSVKSRLQADISYRPVAVVDKFANEIKSLC